MLMTPLSFALWMLMALLAGWQLRSIVAFNQEKILLVYFMNQITDILNESVGHTNASGMIAHNLGLLMQATCEVYGIKFTIQKEENN